MLKKCFIAASLALVLSFSNQASAEHGPEDKYGAMCQATGLYLDTTHSISDLAKNKEARVLQLFGHCGEQPNTLIIDYVTPIMEKAQACKQHNIQVWQSPKKTETYWHFVYNRYYIVDDKNNIISTYREKCSKTSFIEVELPNIMQLNIKRYCSAKVGSPIFPNAQGNLICERGTDEPNLLEQGYMDFMKDKNIKPKDI